MGSEVQRFKSLELMKVDIAAKRHKIHKNNNLHIGISNSYGIII